MEALVVMEAGVDEAAGDDGSLVGVIHTVTARSAIYGRRRNTKGVS